MGIIAINVSTTGLVGDQVNPRRNTMITTDNLATVTTAGYLNNQNINGNPILPTDLFEILYSFNTATQSGTFGIFQVSYASATGYSLVLWENPGNVLLPVVSGDFANFNGTTGQIKDAGYSPTDPAKTKVVMLNAAPTINHAAIFTNANGTIGDGGVLGTAAAKAASDNASATVASVEGSPILNHIAVFADTSGSIKNADGVTAIGGNIQAGLSGTAGTLSSFPATAANGNLIIAGVNAGGAFNTTISNGTMAQSTVYTMGDIGAATGGLVVATSAIRMKSVAGAAAAGGAAAQSFTDAFCTTGSCVVGNWNTQANAASVLKIVPGNGSFVVTSSADAGVGTFNYIITK